jgi:RecB family exonuclease
VRRLKAEMPGRLEGQFEALEIERLARVALEWLEAEKGRSPFRVVMREEPMTLSAGPLGLKGRLDRVDRLEGGELVVIDYKSGRASVGSWVGDRPDEPQLPLYALSMPDPVGAVAFATLKAGQRRFEGLARQPGWLPKVDLVAKHRSAGKHYASWDELLEGWRSAIDGLANAFAAGDARVDPKRQGATCRHCDVAPLCRMRERVALEDEDRRDDDLDPDEEDAVEWEPT